MPASSPSIALVRICAYICPNAVPKGFLQPLRWLAVCQDKMLLQQDERGGRRQAGHATYTHGQQQSACLLFANIQKLIFICLLSLFASGQIVGRHDALTSLLPHFLPIFPGPGPFLYLYLFWHRLVALIVSGTRIKVGRAECLQISFPRSSSTFLLGPEFNSERKHTRSCASFLKSDFKCKFYWNKREFCVCGKMEIKINSICCEPSKSGNNFCSLFSQHSTHSRFFFYLT